MNLPTMATMYSGFGLVEHGLRGLVRPVAAVEYDPQIAEVYARNHGPHVKAARVEDVSYRAWAGVDYLHASPVCTNASQASQNGESEADYIGALTVCRAIDHARPRLFTLENVRGYEHFESFRAIVTTLRRWYAVSWAVWDAADFGTPQNRKRLLLVATRKDWHDGPPVQPVKTHGRKASLFTDAWNGWHQACAPFLDECEPSELAPWQLARLGGWDGVRAMLVHPNADNDRFPKPKDTDPAFTVATFPKSVPKALLFNPNNVNAETYRGRDSSEPAFTTCVFDKGVPRALLCRVNGEGGDLAVPAETPAPTLTADGCGKLRALLESDGVRCVRLSARCLAALQDSEEMWLPKSERLARIGIGGGVPGKMARAVFGPMVEALR